MTILSHPSQIPLPSTTKFLFFGLGKKSNQSTIGLPERERSQRPVRLVAVRVGQRRAPKVVGRHVRQRAGAQHVGVGGHGRYVVVDEVAAETVPVARGDGQGHGRVHGGRHVRPPALFAAPLGATGAATVVLVERLRLLVIVVVVVAIIVVVVVVVMVVVIVVRNSPHVVTFARAPEITSHQRRENTGTGRRSPGKRENRARHERPPDEGLVFYSSLRPLGHTIEHGKRAPPATEAARTRRTRTDAGAYGLRTAS